MLLAGCSIAIVAALARRSPPGIVARAAGQLEAVEADLDARLRATEAKIDALVVHVENVLEETEKAAADATKRNRGARRAQQAAERAGAAGNGGFEQMPVGSPGRIAAIEKHARERGW